MRKLRKDYLTFSILHAFSSLILAFLPMMSGKITPSGYQPSFTVQLLINLGAAGLLSGAFFGPLFIIYGLYQKNSKKKAFGSKQFVSILMISMLIFSSSLVAGIKLKEIEREEHRVQECKTTLKVQTSVTDDPVDVPAKCLDQLRELESLEDLKEGDKIRKTDEGFKVAD